MRFTSPILQIIATSIIIQKSTSQSCVDEPNWIDNTGFGCDWYEQSVGDDQYYYNTSSNDTRCDVYSSCCFNGGHTAATACCACGGGSTYNLCKDVTLGGLPWVDADGDNCSWYEQITVGDDPYYYDDADTRCHYYGGLYPNSGYTAQQACCACGGGVRPQTAPPVTSTPAPVVPVPPILTSAPSSAPIGIETPAPIATEPVTPAPIQQITPVPVQQVTPAPVQQITPAPVQQITPAPVQQVTLVPVEQMTPAPVQQVTPAPVQLITPAPQVVVPEPITSEPSVAKTMPPTRSPTRSPVQSPISGSMMYFNHQHSLKEGPPHRHHNRNDHLIVQQMGRGDPEYLIPHLSDNTVHSHHEHAIRRRRRRKL